MKRLFDMIFAVTALVLLSPLLLLVALLVRLKLGSPVLFRQVRPGLHAAPFTVLKFRTMLDAAGPDGQPLPDSERLTPFGRFLRASSLDELPELWNVVKGDMSLVGPRPLLMEYVPLYTPEQARRHEVRPGITGWAQVNGRNSIEWPRRIELDLEYIQRMSPMLDLRVVLKTIPSVLAGEGMIAGRDYWKEKAKEREAARHGQ